MKKFLLALLLLYASACWAQSVSVTTNFASPPPIGNTTAGTGAFTTLSASSTVSGSGFSTYLASPPAIGATAQAAISGTTGTFTQVVDSGNMQGLRISGTGSAPTLSGCGGGSPSISAGSTRVQGTVTEGTTSTGCVVTWASNFANVPSCTVVFPSGLEAALSWATTISALTVTNTTGSGQVFVYHCLGL